MIENFVEIAKEHGFWAAVAAILVPWAWTIDVRSRKNSQKLETVHDSCHVPLGTVEKLTSRVDALESADSGMVTEISVVKTKLETLDRVEGKLDQVLMHLTKKGLDQ